MIWPLQLSMNEGRSESEGPSESPKATPHATREGEIPGLESHNRYTHPAAAGRRPPPAAA
jgi:hypothetical protein